MKSFCRLSVHRIFYCSLVFSMLASCKKDAGTNTGIVSGAHLTSFTVQNPFDHISGIDSFSYDTNNRLAKYISITYDSTQTPMITDSFSYVFSFPQGSSVPDAYTLTSLVGGTPVPAEVHHLYYDSQDRIIKDTLLNGTNGYVQASFFQYASNNINYTVFNNNSGSFQKQEADTLFIAGSGNVTNVNSYTYYPDNESSFLVNSYGSNASPFYDKTVSGSLGALLYQITYGDFISPYLLNASTINYIPSNDVSSANYTWVTNSQGKVIKGEETTGQFYYSFGYN